MKKAIHPLASIFPELSKAEFERLKGSISTHGQRDPIVLLGDEILDGRNRYKATIELGLTPQFRNFDPARDGNPIQFVADKNLNRRHLTPAQRASVAKKIEDALKEEEERLKEAQAEDSSESESEEGGKSAPSEESKGEKSEEEGEESSGDQRPFRKREKKAADAAGTSARALRDFKFVEKHDKEAAQLVTDGKISMEEAKRRAQAKIDEVSKYRAEAADLMAGHHGDEFADKIRKKTVLRTDPMLKAFSRLTLADQRKIKDLVEEGWAVDKALKFRTGDFSEKDSVGDILSWFRAHDPKDLDEEGWANLEIGGCYIAICKAEKTDEES